MVIEKARKRAWAQFNWAQVKEVLDAAGKNLWTLELEKNEKRQIVVYRLYRSGKLVKRESMPANYRRLPPNWVLEAAREGGILDDLAKALGRPTYEEEQKQKIKDKELYGARYDVKNTGTCAFCFRNQKLTPDPKDRPGERRTMVHHGYKRPGDGEIYDDCAGVGLAPIELEREGVDALQRACALAHVKAEAMLGTVRMAQSFTMRSTMPGQTVQISKGDRGFDEERERRIKTAERELEQAKRRLMASTELASKWESDELPEIRYPRRQPLKLQPIIERLY